VGCVLLLDAEGVSPYSHKVEVVCESFWVVQSTIVRQWHPDDISKVCRVFSIG